MKIVQKQWTQWIPGDPERIWNFFSRPENLARITPGPMNFRIVTPVAGQQMYEGMCIQYTVSPVLRLDMTWLTEITHIRDGRYFVDEQRVGPYALWHHEHRFDPGDGGVLMADLLTYALPFGVFGTLANRLFVERKVEGIFAYRTKVIEQMILDGSF